MTRRITSLLLALLAAAVLGTLRAHGTGATFEGTIVDGRVHLDR